MVNKPRSGILANQPPRMFCVPFVAQAGFGK